MTKEEILAKAKEVVVILQGLNTQDAREILIEVRIEAYKRSTVDSQ